MFYYNAPDCTQLGGCPFGMHHYPDYATETQFQYDSVDVWQNDKDYACSVRWTPTVSAFLGLNAFVTPPSQDAAKVMNSYESAKSHIEACSSMLSADINFYIADFWSEGDLPQVTQEHNLARASVRRLQRRHRERRQNRHLLRQPLL